MKKYPGLRKVKPEWRRQALRALRMQDRHLCYFVNRHEYPCWAEHRPLPRQSSRAGRFCDTRYARTPYYGDERWKISYWRKAITG